MVGPFPKQRASMRRSLESSPTFKKWPHEWALHKVYYLNHKLKVL
jgi:hypothetical protein